jgi:hypothetical protein
MCGPAEIQMLCAALNSRMRKFSIMTLFVSCNLLHGEERKVWGRRLSGAERSDPGGRPACP